MNENKKLFGTDGIRGVAGKYPLDSATIAKIGQSAASILKKISSKRLVIIGSDTRESRKEIVSILGNSLSSNGIAVWNVGVIPTPGISYLVRQYPVLAGIVISASHNPFHDNGIKILNSKGEKISESLENRIEKKIQESPLNIKRTPSIKKKIKSYESLVDKYCGFLIKTFPKKTNLKDMRIVIDCANGATYKVAPKVFSQLGAKVLPIEAEPNGKNINNNCGSLCPKNLAKKVLELKAACGLAFDGDGDRVIFIDEKGEIRDGDYILAVISNFLKSKNKLKNNTLVTTVMANIGLLKAMQKLDINVIKTPVGDRFVYERMKKSKAVIGGEQSGHIIFKDYLPTGDGILSALQVVSIMKKMGKTLSEVCNIMEKYPQVLINVHVKQKLPINSLQNTSKIINDIETQLHNDGRILVRYSGTENLLRVMIEGQNKDLITQYAQQVADTAKSEIENIATETCQN